jgi:hypothetical protein
MLSHPNLIAMAVNCLADICSFRPDDRLLHAAPLSHGSGMYLILAPSRGAENIIDAGGAFDPDRILRFVARERVTVLPFLASTMIVRLLEADPTIRAPELRAIVYGGAPIHLEHLQAALRRFGPVLTQLYGQGESPMTIPYLPAWAHEDADDETLQSAGLVRSGVEVRILDGAACALPQGETGEIAVRGDVVMEGYWRDEEANAASFASGWPRTERMGGSASAASLRTAPGRGTACGQQNRYTCPGCGLNARAEPEVRPLFGKCGCEKPLARHTGGHRHGCAPSAMAANPNAGLSWLGAVLFTLPLLLKESVSRSARSRLVLFIVSDRRRIRYLGSFLLRPLIYYLFMKAAFWVALELYPRALWI